MNLFYVILYHFTTHSNNSKKNLLINRKILNNENLNEIKNVNIIDILINVIVNGNQMYNNNHKYKSLKDILENPFLKEEDKEFFFDIFSKTQKTYLALERLKWIYMFKISKLIIDTDLYMNKISPDKRYVFTLLHHKNRYLFTKSDLTNIIEKTLLNINYGYSEPLPIKNPYNNLPFNKSDLYNIYFFFQSNGYIIPNAFHKYFLSNFHLKNFRDSNEAYVRDEYINNKMKANDSTLKKNILDMIQTFNTSSTKEKICISDTFPDNQLIKTMKPYLLLYYTYIFTYDSYKKNKCREEFYYRMLKFSRDNPLYGRKYITIENRYKKESIMTPVKNKITNYNTTALHTYKQPNFYNNYKTSHISILEEEPYEFSFNLDNLINNHEQYIDYDSDSSSDDIDSSNDDNDSFSNHSISRNNGYNDLPDLIPANSEESIVIPTPINVPFMPPILSRTLGSFYDNNTERNFAHITDNITVSETLQNNTGYITPTENSQHNEVIEDTVNMQEIYENIQNMNIRLERIHTINEGVINTGIIPPNYYQEQSNDSFKFDSDDEIEEDDINDF
jgi:hypothetical protein